MDSSTPRPGRSTLAENHNMEIEDSSGDFSEEDPDLKRILNESLGHDNESDSDSSEEVSDGEELTNILKRKKKCGGPSNSQSQIRRLVTKPNLPNQSSQVARTVRAFTLFIMGMPASIQAYPEAPSTREINTWTEWSTMRFQRLKDHMEKFSKQVSDSSKVERKRRYNEEMKRLRENIPSPPFFPSPNVECTNFKIPFTVKTACEKEIQLGGFGRTTFEWHAKSFTTSTWNASIGGIIMKHYLNWVKGQGNMVLEGLESITGLLDRWVQGQGKELKKLGGLTTAETDKLKKDRSGKNAKSRAKKQISDKRFSCVSTRSTNNALKLVLSRRDIVSDWEDSPGHELPTRIRPIWRSAEFNQIIRCTDDMVMAFAKKAQYLQLRKLFDRQMPEKVEDQWEFVNIPHHLPEDCYEPSWLASLSMMERLSLKMKPPMDVRGTLQTFMELTTRQTRQM